VGPDDGRPAETRWRARIVPLTMTIFADIVQRVRAAVPTVQRVLLFGSMARGESSVDSDIDLLLVVPPAVGKRDCGVRVQMAVAGMGRGVDLIVLHSQEFQALRHSNGSLQRELLREARVLLEAA
jgi:predicted nucleotidyltransferase